MLLDVIRVVAQCLKPVKLFSQQLATFLLFRDRRSVAQQCWIRLHSSSNIVGATHAHYAWFTKTYGLYPSHIAGSCCIRSQTTANTHATTPNIVGATMLEVVASVCTQPKSSAMVTTHASHQLRVPEATPYVGCWFSLLILRRMVFLLVLRYYLCC